MSLMTRVTAQYERIKHLMTGTEEPDQVIAFMLGYLDGESGTGSTFDKGSWYKQGYKHGVMGDAHEDGT